MSGNDVGQRFVDAPGDVACLLARRMVGRVRVREDAGRDVMLLHIRERAFDGPIGLFLPQPPGRPLPERQDWMRMNGENLACADHWNSLEKLCRATPTFFFV